MRYEIERGKYTSPNIVRVVGKKRKVVICIPLPKEEADEFANRIVEFLNKKDDREGTEKA